MPAGSTYTPIATTTASGSVSSITFNSIAGTYTDLVLISSAALGSGAENLRIRFNSDTASNYSFTVLTGTGSAASSTRGSSQTYIAADWNGYLTTTRNISIINIQNYSNTTTNKTALSRSNNAGTGVDAIVGLWRSTSAITSVTILNSGTGGINFASGSTFTLYGIASA
jgi:hypothetical protein